MKTFASRKLLLTYALLSLCPALLHGLPQGSEVRAGSADMVHPDAQNLEIHTSDKAIINYESFNIGHNEKVQFVQPGSGSCVLNRVVGENPSSIMGQLSGNGKVFLVNPQGVYFGPSAQVNVGSLVVSTLDIADEDFLKENYAFKLAAGSEAAKILNEGLLSVSPEGMIALLAPHIQNDGIISAKAGKVALASGEKITLDFVGDKLISFAIQGEVKGGSIIQNGVIHVPEGEVYLRMSSASEVIKRIVNADKVEEASQIVYKDGEIYLMAGSTVHAANIDAQADSIKLEGEVVSTSDLKIVAHDVITMRDSEAEPLILQSNGNFYVESDKIDILALSNEKTSIASGGTMKFVSNNDISADAHFYSGGDFAFLKPSGETGNFKSFYDPIISSTGAVTFGAYSGVSLLVQATGRILPTGTITITGADVTAFTPVTADVTALNTSSSLILRSGLGALVAYTSASPVPPNVVAGGATFSNAGPASLGTDITFTGGTIDITAGSPGQVLLAAGAGGIIFGANTTINAGTTGTVTLTGTVNGDVAGRTLTVNAQTGATSIVGAVGGVQPLGTISLNSTSGDISLNGAVVLGADSTITSTGGGTIILSGTTSVNSDTLVTPRSFTLSTNGTGIINLGAIFGGVSPLNLLSLTSGAAAGRGVDVTANITINAAALTVSGSFNGDVFGRTVTVNNTSGNINFTGNIGATQPLAALSLATTSGNITLGTTAANSVTLGGNSIITTGTGTITVNSILNSDTTARTLAVTTGTSAGVTFGGAVGGTNPLGAMTIITTGAPVSFSSSLKIGASSTFTTTGAGISFTGSVNGSTTGQTLTLSSDAGAILFSSTIGDLQPLGLSLTSTTGSITCSGNAVLGGNSTVSTTTGSISFGGTLDSDNALRTLTINKGSTGTVSFTGAVGSFNPLGAMTITTSGVPVTFSSTLQIGANSTITTVGGTVTFSGSVNGSVPAQTLTVNSLTADTVFNGTVGDSKQIGLTLTTTSGNITLTQPVILGGNTTLNTTSGIINFDLLNSDTMDLRTLTINGGTGNVNFNKGIGSTALGSISSPLGTLSVVTTAGSINFGTILATGNTFLGVTGGGINTLTTSGGSVTFWGTLNGDALLGRPLTISTSGAGNVAFKGTVGNFIALGALTVNSDPDVTFSSAVVLGGATTITTTSGNVTFNQLDSDATNRNLTVQTGAGGAVLFNGLIGSVNHLGNLTVDVSGDNVTFAQNIILGGVTTITSDGGAVLFSGAVTADEPVGRALTITSGNGNVTFNGAVTNMVPAITTIAGAVSFTAPLIISGAATVFTTSGGVSFNQLDSDAINRNLTVQTGPGGAINFNGLIGSVNHLGNLTVDVSGDNVTFAQNIVLSGVTTITTDGGAVLFSGTVTADEPVGRVLSITSGSGNVTFNGAVNNMAPAITTTSGAVSFTAPLIIAGATTVSTTSGAANFDLINSALVDTNTLTVTGGAGAINFNKGIGSTALGAIGVPLGTLTVTDTTGNINFGTIAGTGNVFLGASGGGTNFLTTDGGTVTFNGLVNADTITARPLTINVGGAGNTVFTGAVGGISPLGAIIINTANNITFSSPLVLGGAMTLTSSTGNVNFSTFDSSNIPQALTINLGNGGNVTFNGLVGSTDRLGVITINTNDGLVTFAQDIVLGGNTILATLDGNVHFVGKVNADFPGRTVTITGGTGLVSFDNLVGNIQPFALNVSTTTGGITMSQALVLGGATNLLTNGGSITLSSTVNSDNTARALTLGAAGGNVAVVGTIGGARALSTLTISGNNITLGNVGGTLQGATGLMSLAAAGSITFNGTTYNAGLQSSSAGTTFNLNAGALTTFTSATPPLSQETTTLPIVFPSGHFQLASGSDLTIVTNDGDITVPSILGTNGQNVSISTGYGTITLGQIGMTNDIGNVIVQGASITLKGTINAASVNMSAIGSILNQFAPVAITTSGNASFNSYTGTVATKSSPILVNASGMIFAGSPTFADFNGTSIDGTVHPIPSNPPCILIFNGVVLADCTPPIPIGPPGPQGLQGIQGPTGPRGPAGSSASSNHQATPSGTIVVSNEKVFFLPGIYEPLSIFGYNYSNNLGSDFYFMPDFARRRSLTHTSGTLYWTPK